MKTLLQLYLLAALLLGLISCVQPPENGPDIALQWFTGGWVILSIRGAVAA